FSTSHTPRTPSYTLFPYTTLFRSFCFHLGIAGDMQHKENDEGDNDVAFTYDRKIRFHSPRYVVNLVKYARERFGVKATSLSPSSDRKSTRLNSSHVKTSYAVFCLK